MPNELTNDQRKCLEALAAESKPDGEMCAWFSTIMVPTGLDRRKVKDNVRALAREGLAEYRKGLQNDEGGVAGAGYCITTAGLELLETEKETAA